MSGFDKLQKEVTGTGLCMFCGTCVGVCPSKVLQVNYSNEEPEATKACPPRCEICYEVCPGKDIPMPELEQLVFGRPRNADELTGISQGFAVAHATDPLIRIGGASGGLVSALLIYALENDIIDAAIVCGQTTEQPWRAVAKIATTRQEVLDASQTKSGVSPNNCLLGEAVEKYKRLGVVGVCCHVEGIRKMQLLGAPKKIINSIKFIIGLFCGSNTNHKGIEHIMEEICRVPLDEIAKWRRRDGAYPGLWTVYAKDGRRIVIPDSGRRTYVNAFLKERCATCCDYSSELADVSVGDYLGARMVPGVPGETAVAIRTDIGKKLMEGAAAANYIGTEPITKDSLLGGGWELKKHGNVYRIAERRKFGRPTPDFHWPVGYPEPVLREATEHPHL